MIVASLDRAGSCFPDLDGAILRTCHHPFPFTVERYACDIPSVPFENKEWRRIGRADVEKLYGVMPRGSEEPLVWGDAQSIDLRVGVLNCARTDPR